MFVAVFVQVFVVLSIVFLFAIGLLCFYCVKTGAVVSFFLKSMDYAIVLVLMSLWRHTPTIVLLLHPVSLLI